MTKLFLLVPFVWGVSYEFAFSVFLLVSFMRLFFLLFFEGAFLLVSFVCMFLLFSFVVPGRLLKPKAGGWTIAFLYSLQAVIYYRGRPRGGPHRRPREGPSSWLTRGKGREGLPNWPRIDSKSAPTPAPKSTPNRSRSGPNSAPNRPEIEPKQAQHLLQIGFKSGPN